MAAGNAAAVYAADAPAPIQSTYEINDVIYFDAGSDAFSSYPEEYLSDMLTNKSSQLGGFIDRGSVAGYSSGYLFP